MVNNKYEITNLLEQLLEIVKNSDNVVVTKRLQPDNIFHIISGFVIDDRHSLKISIPLRILEDYK